MNKTPVTESQLRALTPEALKVFSPETLRHVQEIARQAGVLQMRDKITGGEGELTVENLNRYFTKMAGQNMPDEDKVNLAHLVQEFVKASPETQLKYKDTPCSLATKFRNDRNAKFFVLSSVGKNQIQIKRQKTLPLELQLVLFVT